MNFVAKLHSNSKNIGEILVLLSILSYATGFLIINIHLASYGVTSIELLKGRYVLSGAVFLLFFLPTLASGFFIGKIVGEKKQKSEWKKLIKIVPILPVIILMFSLIGPLLIYIVLLLGVNSHPDNVLLDRIQFGHLLSDIWSLKTIINFFYLILITFFNTVLIVLITFVLFYFYTYFKSLFFGKKKALPPLKDVLTAFKSEYLRSFLILAFEFIILISVAALSYKISVMLFHPNDRFLLQSQYANTICQRLFIIAVLLITVVIIYLYTSITEEKLNESNVNKKYLILDKLSMVKYTSPLLLCTIVFTIWYYSSFVFPLMPSEIGGGLPTSAQIFTNDLILKDLFSKGKLLLLDRNDKVYIISIQSASGNSIVQVPIDKIYVVTGIATNR